VIKAETPVLSSEEACKLLDSIERYTLIGPGDGAPIVTMVYSFARVSAAITMKAGNCFQHRKRCRLRLHQKAASATKLPVRLVWSRIIQRTFYGRWVLPSSFIV
jgi:hypothetical protein